MRRRIKGEEGSCKSHLWGEWETKTEPTCTERGEKVRVCESCGVAEREYFNPLGHDYAETEFVEPTETKDGSRIYTCSRCGRQYKEIIRKTNTDEEEISVVFHFTNIQNKYDDYRMWTWTVGDGIETIMDNNQTEATCTLNVPASTSDLFYIVKIGRAWDQKDIDSDRAIDLSYITGGTVDVYLTSGVVEAVIDDSNAVKKGEKKKIIPLMMTVY